MISIKLLSLLYLHNFAFYRSNAVNAAELPHIHSNIIQVFQSALNAMGALIVLVVSKKQQTIKVLRLAKKISSHKAILNDASLSLAR